MLKTKEEFFDKMTQIQSDLNEIHVNMWKFYEETDIDSDYQIVHEWCNTVYTLTEQIDDAVS